MSFQNRVTKLQKATGLMMRTQPFWASLLMTMNFSERKDIETITTDGETIGYNPEWMETLNQDQIVGVLAHVAGHCALLHPLRRGGRVRVPVNPAALVADTIRHHRVVTRLAANLANRLGLLRRCRLLQRTLQVHPSARHLGLILQAVRAGVLSGQQQDSIDVHHSSFGAVTGILYVHPASVRH